MKHRALIVLVTMLFAGSAGASYCGIDSSVFFTQGSTTLDDPVGLEKMLEPTRRLLANGRKVAAFEVSGHADQSEGTEAQVKLLSSARAARVAAYVGTAYPDIAALIETKSYGSKHSFGPGREDVNRRVEVEVVSPCSMPPPGRP